MRIMHTKLIIKPKMVEWPYTRSKGPDKPLMGCWQPEASSSIQSMLLLTAHLRCRGFAPGKAWTECLVRTYQSAKLCTKLACVRYFANMALGGNRGATKLEFDISRLGRLPIMSRVAQKITKVLQLTNNIMIDIIRKCRELSVCFAHCSFESNVLRAHVYGPKVQCFKYLGPVGRPNRGQEPN